MFYSRNSRVDHDYYNSYGYERRVERETLLNTLIKILVILFLITLIIASYVFIKKEQAGYGVLNGLPNQPQQVPLSYQVKEEPFVEEGGTLTKAEQQKRQLSTEEITQIVQIVMMQLRDNVEQKKIPVQKNLSVKDDEGFVKALMSVEMSDTFLPSESAIKNTLSLKESNHYNKMVVQSDNRLQESTEDPMIQLSNALNNALETTTVKDTTAYTQSISKEIDVRSNEMRVMMVQKGDTLSKISERAYGDPDAYPKIFMANPEVIRNPDQIFVGQKLRIPF